ncbi:MAG: M28 family peptidase [Bryobacteraceae bacterium]
MASRLLSFFILLSLTLTAQLRENPSMRPPEQPNPKTLIPQSLIETLVSEVSGSVGLSHILELASYERDRLSEEYKTVYREAAYIEKMAKQYNLEDVHIERFPMPQKQWDGELGELWLEKPNKRLIVSYRDIAASLAVGSKTADVTSELIYCGHGDKKTDYADKNVSGKIVLVSGPPGAAANMAVREFGAAGVVSFNNPTGRPFDRPDQIAWNGLNRGFGGGDSAKPTFAFNLSHRMGIELVEALEKGEKLTVHAKVKATEYDTPMQVPTAVIKGDGSSDQEIALAGHLFEGVAKQGAMDDASGCAMVLEIARAWKNLIDEGVVPRPKRTVRFMWVPEIAGSGAYLRKYQDETKRMIAAISIDMAGGDVTKSRNSFRLMRTPYSVNSFVNDVSQQFFEFVGETNREKVNNRRIVYNYMFPILDPSGSRDQFYYNIEKHYGASDHTVFLGQGIPAILYNNWPDVAYHTSEDRPLNADATQIKRTAFIGLASAMVMAGSDGPGAIRVAEMITGYASERSARELGLALQGLGDGGTLREALARIKCNYEREIDAIRSAEVLADKDKDSAAKIEMMAKSFAETGLTADTERVKTYAKVRGISASQMTAEESEAAKWIPVRKKLDAPQGFGGGGGRGQVDGTKLNGMGASEAKAFADGKRSILEIRDHVSSEFGAMDSKLFIDYFQDLAKKGDFELRVK